MKKVLILTNSGDSTTNEVMAWLDNRGVEIIRINETAFFDKYTFHITTNKIKRDELNSDILKIDDILAVWYRKSISTKHEIYLLPNVKVQKHLEMELFQTYRFFLSSLPEQTRSLGLISLLHLNKMYAIIHAQKVEIKTPTSLVTNSKKALIDFHHQYQSVITKCISDGEFFLVEGKSYGHYTSVIDEDIINQLPETFFPSFFQKKIEKKYEIRVFYLDKKCYSMAIFSQQDDQTTVDFRRYNEKKPNRTVPYQLPQGLEEKIGLLMDSLSLNTGSLDFIREETTGHYIFLEVNPVGQFGMVSHPCNYFLEKKVAEFLCI